MAAITINYDTDKGTAEIYSGAMTDTPGDYIQKRAFLRKFGLHFPAGDSQGTWNEGGLYNNIKLFAAAFEAVYTGDTLTLVKTN